MEEGMDCGGLPFLGTGCPIPDVDILCLLCIDFYVWDAVSIFNRLPRMFLSTNFAFRITDWTCYHGPHLHAILRIISRVVSGLATDSPCGGWGRWWTTCLLHDSPFFGSHFKMRVGMLVWSDISYIYYFLPRFTVSCMKLVIFFLLYNNLFIYQVLCTLIYRRRSVYSFLIEVVVTYMIHCSMCVHCWSFVRWIHRWRVVSPDKGSLTTKTVLCHDVIMVKRCVCSIVWSIIFIELAWRLFDEGSLVQKTVLCHDVIMVKRCEWSTVCSIIFLQ